MSKKVPFYGLTYNNSLFVPLSNFIRWRSISMRAGPAFLQFDWSKAGLSMICQSSYIPIRRPASDFFQDRENIGKLFMWLQIFYFKQRRGNLTGLLFCLDFVCQGLLITKIVICIHYLIVSSPHAVRPTTLVFCMSVNMYVFNLKSCQECRKTRKKSRK